MKKHGYDPDWIVSYRRYNTMARLKKGRKKVKMMYEKIKKLNKSSGELEKYESVDTDDMSTESESDDDNGQNN